MGKTFWDLLSESVIFQGALTMMVTGTWCYIIICGTTPPDYLNMMVGTIVGFFFGGKLVAAAQKAQQSSAKKEGE